MMNRIENEKGLLILIISTGFSCTVCNIYRAIEMMINISLSLVIYSVDWNHDQVDVPTFIRKIVTSLKGCFYDPMPMEHYVRGILLYSKHVSHHHHVPFQFGFARSTLPCYVSCKINTKTIISSICMSDIVPNT